MSQTASVFFTGMEPSDAEQLAALFQDINRRTGNRWSLATNADGAGMLVIDVDTLYGHMTWLRAQHTGQTVVALTTQDHADADHVLHRPVTPEAMRRLLLNARSENAPAVAGVPGATTPPVKMPSVVAPSQTQTIAPTPAEPVSVSPAPVAPVVASVTTPAPNTPAASPTSPPAVPARAFHLIDLLLSGQNGTSAQALNLPGLPALLFDVGQKVFVCGNTLKTFLPHAQAVVPEDALTPVDAERFEAHRAKEGTQPFSRLLWLAALGGAHGEVPGGSVQTRYRLVKWPQIEREFPKHFRIATAMMKGLNTLDEIAALSGATREEVADFTAAYIATGHAEAESTTTGEAQNPQKSLLERLRGAR